MLTTLVFDKIFKQKSVCSRLLIVAPLPDLGTVRFVYLFSSKIKGPDNPTSQLLPKMS